VSQEAYDRWINEKHLSKMQYDEMKLFVLKNCDMIEHDYHLKGKILDDNGILRLR